ncbi:hypothetical protein [Novacetimonas hansenii]|uniref:hypothetical protein n=1 Tax=Novacetimonas hansenii TaxID=436 RepID=UPI00094FEDAC|nr:hypothetical protein [Novacetimonas hansenii]
MRPVSLCIPALLLAGLVTTQTARADDALGQPMARLCFSVQSVAVAGGYTWGKGRLFYGTHSYPVRIRGGGAVGIGYSHVLGDGAVYNLTRLPDLNGTYWAVKAEATVARGGHWAVMENNNNINIKISAHTNGAHLSAAVMRLTLKVDPARGDNVSGEGLSCKVALSQYHLR